METDELFTVGHISEFCGVSVKTLRYYDDIDLVSPVFVNPLTRYRYYSPEQVEVFFLIKILRELGFSLAQIKNALVQKRLEGLVNLFRERGESLKKDIEILQDQLLEVTRLLGQYERMKIGRRSQGAGAVVLKKLADRPIVSLRVKTAYEGLSFKKAYEHLDERIAKRGLRVRKTMMAIIHGDYREFDSHHADLEFFYEVLSKESPQKKYVQRLPGGLYASLLFTGKYEEFRKRGYPHLYTWIGKHGYMPSGHSVEIYHITRPVSRIVGDFVTELQVPVKKKQ